MRKSLILLPLLVLVGCELVEVPGTAASFDLDGDWSDPDRFFDFPYPSDLRLTGEGRPDVEGFPTMNRYPAVAALQSIAGDVRGFSVIQGAWFRFSAPLGEISEDELVEASVGAPILLVDVDPESPERGRLFPLVATTLPEDDYIPANILAVAPRQGIVLHPGRTYAYVVMRELRDAEGELLGVSRVMEAVKAGRRPVGPRGEAARLLYEPLWKTLQGLEIRVRDVAAATVFTTGDVVEELAAISDAVLAAHTVEITDLRLDPDDGNHSRYCELIGTVRYPQFQTGTPPFNETGGLFEFDGLLPLQQREEEAPVVITLPKGEMPRNGYPLMLYFHGSGGLHSEVVDRGRTPVVGGEPAKGEGPAHVVAPFGLATAGSAMPVNPERLPGASDIAYLNLTNLPAFRDTFRQGVIEQRLFLRALLELEITPSQLSGCAGPSLPDGATRFRFNPAQVVGMGQSMGGMYTNMVGAVEPRIRAVVPTGAGGYWTWFILRTSLVPGQELLPALIGVPGPLTHLHPVLQLAQGAWEPAEPLVYTPRLARRPLRNHPVRPIYQPVGMEDRYFPEPIFDALALAYGTELAGPVVWESMQEALELEGRKYHKDWPVYENRTSERLTDVKYTGVVVQYAGDGLSDPHNVAFQLDAVKRQYSCFFDTFLKGGPAIVHAPGPLTSPCRRD